MDQFSTEWIVIAGTALVAVGAFIWGQVRPNHRVRRSLQRADQRARAFHRH